jgi:hypothetical protein
MRAERRRWSDLTPGQRVGVVIGAIVQFALMALAQRDLSRRPAGEIRGPKAVWRVAVLVNFVGPIVYFVFGRRAGEPTRS